MFDPGLGYTCFFIGSMLTVLTKRIGQKQSRERHRWERKACYPWFMTFCLLATDTCLAKLLGGLVIPMAFFCAFCNETNLVALYPKKNVWAQEMKGKKPETFGRPEELFRPFWTIEQNTQTRSMFRIWLNNILLVYHRTNSDGQMCQGPLAGLPWHLSNSTQRLNGMYMLIMLCPNWFSCSTQPDPTTTPQYAAALRDEPCVAMGTVNTQGPNKATGNICIRAQSVLSNRWLQTYNSAWRKRTGRTVRHTKRSPENPLLLFDFLHVIDVSVEEVSHRVPDGGVFETRGDPKHCDVRHRGA